MKYAYALSILILALLLAGFISQNSQDTVLNYFFWQTIPLPLSLFMILSFAVGYALAVLVGLGSGFRSRFRASTAEREARQLRSELENFKTKEAGSVAGDDDTEGVEDPS